MLTVNLGKLPLLTILFLTSASLSLAQYGASPSQTGLFFDDLRTRSNQSTLGTGATAGVRSGEAVYDYQSESASFTEAAGGRPMGDALTVSGQNEAARQMGQPAYRGGSSAYAARAVGDYTYYSSQYSSPSTFFAPTYISDPFLGGRRNLKIGGVNVGFGLFSSVEYNDNVTRSTTDPVEDIIGSMMLNIDANYQVTKNNRLTLTTAIGFDHYFEHPEVAPYGSGDFVLNVLPGSTIAFDMKIGPVYVTIYDRFSVRPAVRNDFGLAANQIFGMFQNDAGLAAMWQINSSLTASINYMHSNARAFEEEFEIFDRDMDSLHGNVSWSPSGTWSLAVEGGVSWVTYPTGYNNDGLLLNGGVVFSTPLGKSTFLRVAGGIQSFDFDAPPEIKVSESAVKEAEERVGQFQRQLDFENAKLPGMDPGPDYLAQERRIEKLEADLAQATLVAQTRSTQRQQQLDANTQDVSDLSDYYFNLTLTNQLSSRVSQVLSLGHESALNNVSNFITADYINYGIGIIAWRGSRLSVSAYYEDAEMSGGTQAEDLSQYGFDAYVSHNLNSWCRLGVGYHYGNTDSNLKDPTSNLDRDFEQNAFSADLNFLISRKATLSFGYRYFTTDAEDPQFAFDQNRFVMALNYNF
jgi:hypothetical protein